MTQYAPCVSQGIAKTDHLSEIGDLTLLCSKFIQVQVYVCKLEMGRVEMFVTRPDPTRPVIWQLLSIVDWFLAGRLIGKLYKIYLSGSINVFCAFTLVFYFPFGRLLVLNVQPCLPATRYFICYIAILCSQQINDDDDDDDDDNTVMPNMKYIKTLCIMFINVN